MNTTLILKPSQLQIFGSSHVSRKIWRLFASFGNDFDEIKHVFFIRNGKFFVVLFLDSKNEILVRTRRRRMKRNWIQGRIEFEKRVQVTVFS